MKIPKNNDKLNKERKKRQLEKQKATTIKKLKSMRLVFILAFFALSCVIVYEKLAFGDSFERRAIEQQIVKGNVDVIINPNRGSILDRYKHTLAVSRTVYNVVLDVRTLLEEDTKEVLRKKETPTIKNVVVFHLSEILEIEEDVIYSYLGTNTTDKSIDYAFGIKASVQKKPTKYQIVAKSIEKDKADLIAKLIEEGTIRFVHLEEDTKRNYTNDNFGSQLLGFMRADIKWGLERQYNEYLAGVEGRSFMRYNDFDTATNETINPEQGKTVITTIDLKIQGFAEDIVNKIGKEFNPVNTSIIAMNPHTGEILAYSQYPNVNLNFPSDISKMNNELIKIDWDLLSEEEQYNKLNSVWKDFNATSTFEPGSIYKPMVVAAALQEGAVKESDTFFCGGGKYFGSTPIPCWNTHGHGTQTLSQVLSNSCNVGMMEIVEKLGYEKYYDYQHDFGFGEKTGLDVPNEQSASSLLNTLKQLQNPIYLATNSMGQGFNSTAIQNITAFSAVINGGNLMKPYVVSQVVDKHGSIAKENQPTLVRKVISKETSDFLKIELENTVSRSGTGSNAIIQGYKIGGKTGTAQQFKRSDKLFAQSFMGYLTVDNPEVIALAVIYLPEDYVKTDKIPTTMIRELFLNIIKYKGIQPTGTISDSDSIDISDESISVEDYTGRDLVDVSKSLNSYGFDFEFVGSSGTKVKRQIPMPGTKVSKKSKIFIYIAPDETNKNVSVIPNVIGLTLEAATKIIKESNLTFVTEEAFYDEEIGVSTVESTTSLPEVTAENTTEPVMTEVIVNQMPSPKIEVSEGTEIKLKIKKQFK